MSTWIFLALAIALEVAATWERDGRWFAALAAAGRPVVRLDRVS